MIEIRSSSNNSIVAQNYSCESANFIHLYKPLIKTAYAVAVYNTNNGQLFAIVSKGKANYTIPINDESRPNWINTVRLLNGLFPIVHKKAGIPHHVTLCPALRGGMFDKKNMLAGQPEYAIGNVIHKDALELTQLERKRKEIEEERDTLNNSDDHLINSNKLEEISQRILAISQNKLLINKTLPIDFQKSSFRVERNASLSIEVYRSTLDAKVVGSNQAITDLLTQVFSKEDASVYLPPGTISKVARGISHMLDTKGSVTFIGSSVTLERSKILDPIVIRSNANIDKAWRDNPHDYVVLTEAVLGGFFLGYEKQISGSNGNIENEICSNLSTISVISQGAIPKISMGKSGEILAEVYDSWLHDLKHDPNSGFPIGYKYRDLSDVLSELPN